MRMTAVNWMNCTHCQPDCVKTYLRIVQGVTGYHALYTFSYICSSRGRSLKTTSPLQEEVVFSDQTFNGIILLKVKQAIVSSQIHGNGTV